MNAWATTYREPVQLGAMLFIGVATVAAIWLVANKHRNHPIDTIPLAELQQVRLETGRNGEVLVLVSRAELEGFRAAFRARKPFRVDAPSISTYCKLEVETVDEVYVFRVSPFRPPDIFGDMGRGRTTIAIDVLESQFWMSTDAFRDAEQAALGAKSTVIAELDFQGARVPLAALPRG